MLTLPGLAIVRGPTHDAGMTRRILALAALATALCFTTTASAKVYKYTKADGTVVYTDKLSDLPAARRAHYNRIEQEAKQRRKARVNMLGKAEVERREAEAERKRVQEAKLEADERARRLAEINATLERIRKDNERTAGKKKVWKDRLQKAKQELKDALQAFRDKQKEYKTLAIKPNFARLPGENQKVEKLRKEVAALEKRVDDAIRELYVVIPEQARKKGVPPGWLR